MHHNNFYWSNASIRIYAAAVQTPHPFLAPNWIKGHTRPGWVASAPGGWIRGKIKNTVGLPTAPYIRPGVLDFSIIKQYTVILPFDSWYIWTSNFYKFTVKMTVSALLESVINLMAETFPPTSMKTFFIVAGINGIICIYLGIYLVKTFPCSFHIDGRKGWEESLECSKTSD